MCSDGDNYDISEYPSQELLFIKITPHGVDNLMALAESIDKLPFDKRDLVLRFIAALKNPVAWPGSPQESSLHQHDADQVPADAGKCLIDLDLTRIF